VPTTALLRTHKSPISRLAVFSFLLLAAAFASGQTQQIDAAASKVTIHVYKSGFFSAFADNHVITAPTASGTLDMQKRSVELSFRARDMKVVDPNASESTRNEVEQRMLSAQVLDAQHFPEIRFASTKIKPQDAFHYLVRGDLTLHGVTRAVEMTVAGGERYSGTIKLKQTDFGITPIKIGGGAVKVKDEIEVTFEIVAGKK
jgi:polyisoprenoid-binding protein YceI